MTRKRKPPTKRGPAFQACEQCNGTGWRDVVYEAADGDVAVTVARCFCWLAFQEKLKER